MKDHTYWAARAVEEFVNEAHQRIRDFYEDLRDTGIYYNIERSYRAYYGGNLSSSGNFTGLFDSSRMHRSGKSGEITNLKVNHFRNLIQHSLQLATAQRPVIACRATNSDYRSQTQCVLGNGIIDYYLREKKLSRHFTQAVEYGLVLTEGWIHTPWNPTSGEVFDIDPETGAPIHEGDLDFSTHHILDVVRDINLKNDDEYSWLMVRNFKNRYELAAKYQDLAEEILNASDEAFDYCAYDSFDFHFRARNTGNSSLVPVWTFYHKKTNAMPQGRMVVFVDDIVLFDGPIPYRSIPLYSLSPSVLINTPYGYSPAFEILAPQQALDVLTSTIMTNQATNGVQNIWVRGGDNLSVENLSGGMKLLQSEEKPEPLNLTYTPAEVFRFRQEMIQEMETLAGISATVRGNPEANLKSGAALALVVSQSIQFSSMLEASYNQLIEDVGTAVIDQIRVFAKTKRVANILGESSRPYQKEFTADDLSQINRVVVEQASPLSKTTSGRIEMANNLLEKGLIETPKQFITVMTTGQLDPAIEGTQHSLLNIRAENESMRNGSDVVAVVTENHADHIREHKVLLENPEAKQDPELVNRVLAHIQEHLDLWRSADPAVLMITGQEPPPPPPAPPVPGAPNTPPPAPPAGPNQGPVPGLPQVMAPEVGTPVPEGELPNLPKMPALPDQAPPEAQQAYDKILT